jgi:hypothetical protein
LEPTCAQRTFYQKIFLESVEFNVKNITNKVKELVKAKQHIRRKKS